MAAFLRRCSASLPSTHSAVPQSQPSSHESPNPSRRLTKRSLQWMGLAWNSPAALHSCSSGLATSIWFL